MSAQNLIRVGAVFCLLAVVLDSFGAHALKSTITPERLNIWHTATKYQMYHGLALVLCAILSLLAKRPTNSLNGTAWSFIIGTLLFSGSLYGLVLLDAPKLGAITPIGGSMFIVGWTLLFFSTFNKEDKRPKE
jgi:uncharacterized membrane protein YgdD (TMEM256/DUF423 family)